MCETGEKKGGKRGPEHDFAISGKISFRVHNWPITSESSPPRRMEMDNQKKHASLYRGLFFAFLSGLSFCFSSVIVKLVSSLHPGQLALYRFIATFIMAMPETVKTGQNPLGPPEFRLLIWLMGVFCGLGIFANFIAFRYLGLGEASVIIVSSPVVVTLYARVFFKEPCQIFQSISVLLNVVGIIFTAKLPSRLTEIPASYSGETIYGLLAAVLSMLCISGMQLITRKVRSVPQSIVTLNLSWVGIIEIAVLTAILGNFKWHECGIQSLYILLLALVSYSGVAFLVLALQCEYAGPVSTMKAATDIVLAFLWQIILFHDVPDSYGIIGAVLVVVSIVLVSLDKLLPSLECTLFPCKKFMFF